jgi:hypothetical protein
MFENQMSDPSWHFLLILLYFAAGIVDTGGNLPPVLFTLVANLPPVSTPPAVLMTKFSAGVVDTGGAP